jgi:hypothetical protein
MVTVDRVSDGIGQVRRAAEEGPDKEFPEFKATFIDQAYNDDRLYESFDPVSTNFTGS